jgi:hypothetical protein
MFPSQAAIGLALLPMTWAANDAAANDPAADRPRVANGAAQRSQEDDLVRYFPAGWSRESLPDWPAVSAQAVAPALRRVKSKWQDSVFAALLRRALSRG